MKKGIRKMSKSEVKKVKGGVVNVAYPIAVGIGLVGGTTIGTISGGK